MTTDTAVQHRPDALEVLCQPAPLDRTLAAVHAALQGRLPAVHRAAVAVLDDRTGALTTSLASRATATTLVHHQSTLANPPSLEEVAGRRTPRVVDDLSVFDGGPHEHTRPVSELGFRASTTLPLFAREQLVGFVFLSSHPAGCFTAEEPAAG